MAPSLRELLSAPFPIDQLRWLPKNVKGNRALALPYVSARSIAERLDDVFGVGGWSDNYDFLANDSVVCKLTCVIDGQKVTKVDVGSPSEQPDAGDRIKAAVSDSLKRAAVKFGIGRYLYGLPQVWWDYDPAKRQFVGTPRLPGAAPTPAAPQANGKPSILADGKALKERLLEGEKKSKGIYDFVVGCGKTRGWSPDPAKWKGSQLDDALKFGVEFKRRVTAKDLLITQEQQDRIQEGINPAGARRLELLAQTCLACAVFSADDMTSDEACRVIAALGRGDDAPPVETEVQYQD